MTDHDLRAELHGISTDISWIKSALQEARQEAKGYRAHVDEKLDCVEERIIRLEATQIPRSVIDSNTKQTITTETRHEDSIAEEARRRAEADARRDMGALVVKTVGAAVTLAVVLVQLAEWAFAAM